MALKHGHFDGAHNEDALIISDCDVCLDYATRIFDTVRSDGVEAGRKLHLDSQIAFLETSFRGEN